MMESYDVWPPMIPDLMPGLLQRRRVPVGDSSRPNFGSEVNSRGADPQNSSTAQEQPS